MWMMLPCRKIGVMIRHHSPPVTTPSLSANGWLSPEPNRTSNSGSNALISPRPPEVPDWIHAISIITNQKPLASMISDVAAVRPGSRFVTSRVALGLLTRPSGSPQSGQSVALRGTRVRQAGHILCLPLALRSSTSR